MKILAIDPGLRGAWVSVIGKGETVHPLVIQKLSNISLYGISVPILPPDFFLEAESCDFLVIERQAPLRGAPLGSTFQIGAGFGALLSQLLKFSEKLVSPVPSKWTGDLARAGLVEPRSVGGTKASLQLAKHSHPRFEFLRGVTHDGISDALAIAWWCHATQEGVLKRLQRVAAKSQSTERLADSWLDPENQDSATAPLFFL